MVGLLHGRMPAAEKAAVMSLFVGSPASDSTGLRMDVLVSTTVIEVGVDVPNASLMVIEHAERFGLSQLHQLRGRVGRGAVASVCVLLYTPPLSDTGKSRLKAMVDTNDGFEIARRDLEIRGPGRVPRRPAVRRGAPALRRPADGRASPEARPAGCRHPARAPSARRRARMSPAGWATKAEYLKA